MTTQRTEPADTLKVSVLPTDDGEYLKALLGVDFTRPQLDIITAPLEPQLVVAGAGSGKTMVMAARVVHAVAHYGVAPASVLGLTFTNKAAGELAERIRRCLARLGAVDRGAGGVALTGVGQPSEPADDSATVATYHSYAAGLVRDHALRIGREPGATLLTEAVQWQLAMRVATRAPGPFSHLRWTTPYVAGLVVALAGDLSDHLASAEQVREHDAKVRAAVAALDKPLKDVRELFDVTYERDELLELVAAYTKEKERLDVIDYGDQVALACRIVEAAPEVVARERERYELVVLDEYQDTNVAQRELLRRLFGTGHAVTAVGDPNQSIYGWRGASTGNLAHFPEHFVRRGPALGPQALMTSFRCGGRILTAANAVVAPLSEPPLHRSATRVEIPDLSPVGARSEAGEVIAARLSTAVDEARWVAEKVADEIASARPPREIAVLSRRRADFSRLHAELAARDVPVEVVGLGGLLAMPEVSDIVSVLSLLADATSNPDAVRLLTGPRWRVGVRDMAALGFRAAGLVRARGDDSCDDSSDDSMDDAGGDIAAAVQTEGAEQPAVANRLEQVLQEATNAVDPVEVPSLLEAVESPGPPSLYSPAALERLARFAAEIRRLRGLAGQPLVDVVTEVIKSTGLDVEIEAGDRGLAEARMANVHTFLDVAAQFAGLDGDADLVAFLAYLKAARDNEDGLDVGSVSDANTVKLMTVHAAKGLEWDVVVVPGLVDKTFPSSQTRRTWAKAAHVLPFRCRGDAEDLPHLAGYAKVDIDAFTAANQRDCLDEERRLAYVAFTRARQRLLLSSYVWSATRQDPCEPSCFLSEVCALGEAAVTVEHWVPDGVKGDPNPLLAEGVADIDWPAVPDSSTAERRRAAAELVNAARAQRAAEPPELSDAPVAIATPASDKSAVWARDAELLLAELRRRGRRTIDVAVPSRLTTSQIVALGRDPDAFAAALARPMPSAPVAQARRGSRFHRWVEELYGDTPLLAADDLPGAEDAEMSDEELAALQEQFLADGWGERRPVAVEASFETVIGGRLVRGRIDAVYPDETNDGAGEAFDVIDFKTGAIPTGRDFEAASLQLSIYRLAWADLAEVDPARVRAGFLYVRSGELKRPQRLLDRHELAALLTAP